MKKLIVYGLAGVGTLASGLLVLLKLRSKRAGGTGTSQEVVGKSGLRWLLEATGQQIGPAYGNQLWNVYTVTSAGMTPVLAFQQIGADQSTRTIVAVAPDQAALGNSAIGDLGIKTPAA